MLDLFHINDLITMQFSFYIVLALNVIIISYYLLGRKTANIKYMVLGNLTYLLFFLVIIYDINDIDHKYPMVVGFLDVIAITFWVIGVNSALHIKNRRIFYIILNTINVIAILVLFNAFDKLSIARSISSLIALIVVIVLMIDMAKKQKEKTLTSYYLILYVLIGYSIYKVSVVIYRFTTMSSELNIESIRTSINIITLLGLMFALTLNFAIVFLIHDALNKEVEELSLKDFLTKLPNRRMITNKIEELLELNKRGKLNFAVVLFDIDDFKKVNDVYGHHIGDIVLKEFSNILLRSVRKIDFVSRYGGEEFLVLLQVDQCKEAEKFVNRIFNNLKNTLFSEHKIPITISGGLVLIGDENLDFTTIKIIDLADKRLYHAKANGKNQVVKECI